jgi:hypothetical protein
MMSVSEPRWTDFLGLVGVDAWLHIAHVNFRTQIAMQPVCGRKTPVQIRRSADPATSRFDAT